MYNKGDNDTINPSLLKKSSMVLFAIIVLSAGIAMVAISSSFLTAAQSCQNYGDKNFFPETVITATCQISSVTSQELMFNAYTFTPAQATLPGARR